MALATGVFNTVRNPAELNARSFAATILRLFPNGSAPLFGLTSQTGRSKAKSSTHGYFSKTLSFASCLINNGAGYTNVATVFAVDGPGTTGMTEQMLVYVPRTKEVMRIVSVDSAAQITVTRSFGRVAAAALVDNDPLVIIGTAFNEGSSRPTARGLTLVYVPNYTQIFRNAWAVTDTARASYAEAGISNIAENRRDCMLFHSIDIESSLFFAQPKMDTSGTQPAHSTQGVIDAVSQYAPANVTTAGGTTTFAQLVTALEPAFLYSSDMGNPKERVFFGGSTAIKVLNDIGKLYGQVQTVNAQTSYGLRFTSFNFYKGTVHMIEHPLFNGIPGMTGLGVLADLAAIKLAYMDGRDTKNEEYGGAATNNNASGVDADGGSLTTELACELINPFSWGVIFGLTAAA